MKFSQIWTTRGAPALRRQLLDTPFQSPTKMSFVREKVQCQHPRNTTQTTAWKRGKNGLITGMLISLSTVHNCSQLVPIDPALAEVDNLAYWLERFKLFWKSGGKNAEEYNPNSRHHLFCGILRWVRLKNPGIDFFKDEEFQVQGWMHLQTLERR